MADIKTRSAEKGTIKTLDKASVAASRMKHSYARTKELVEEKQKSTEGSPAEYAVNRLSGAGNTLMRKGGGKFNEAGGKSVTVLKNEIRQRRQGIKDKGSDISRSSYTVRRPGTKIKKAGRSSNEISYSANKHALSKRLAQKRLTGKHVKYSGVRKGAVRAIHAVRAIAASLKTLFVFLFAGGWIAVLAVVICCLFGAALYFFGDSSSNDYLPVSAEVESYTPVIEKYAKEYGIPEYVELIKAVMMQESGGQGYGSHAGFRVQL